MHKRDYLGRCQREIKCSEDQVVRRDEKCRNGKDSTTVKPGMPPSPETSMGDPPEVERS